MRPRQSSLNFGNNNNINTIIRIVVKCLTPNQDRYSTQDVTCHIQDSQYQQTPIPDLSSSETTTTTLDQTLTNFKATNQDNSYQHQDINIIPEITDSHPTPLELTNPPPIIQTIPTILTTTTTTQTRAAKTTLQRKEIL